MWIEVISNTTFKLLNSCGFTKLDILKLSYQNIPFQTPDCKVYLVSWASLTTGFKDYSKEMMLLLNGQAMSHDEVWNPESDIQSHLNHALGWPNLDQQQRSQSCFSNRDQIISIENYLQCGRSHSSSNFCIVFIFSDSLANYILCV